MLTSIATDWKECGEDLYSMNSVANLSHRFSNLIIGLHSTAVLFYGIGVVALRDGDDVADRELFLKMELPFESGTSPIYEVVMTTQFLHQMTAATVIGVLSALLVTLVSWGREGSQPLPPSGEFSSSRLRLPPGMHPLAQPAMTVRNTFQFV